MKTKLIIFILTLLVLIPELSTAATQDLTYDNPTNQVNISYDALNRILTKNSTSINITYAYDHQYEGTLTNITFGNSTFKYEYDDRLRVINETRTIDGIQFEKGNYHDSMDRLAKQILIPGEDTDYYYNNQSKLSRILNFVNTTFHNAFGNTLNRTYANTRVTEFTYDSQNGRLAQIKTGGIQQLNYSYDRTGNIITINDTANNRNYTMTYDFLDRLANATIGSNTFVYSYNAIGNILKIVRDGINTTKFVYSNKPVHAPSQVVTGDAGIDVSKQSELYSYNKSRVIQFYLANEKNATLTNANWTIDFSNTIVNSTVAFNITQNETLLIVAENNYTNAGDYRISITGRASSASIDFENQSSKFGIKISKLSLKSLNISNATFELAIYNDMNLTSQNVNWQCDTASNGPFTLAGYGSRIENFSINYSSPGNKQLTCLTNSTDGNDTRTIGFNIKGIAIEDYNVSSIATNNRFVTFNITNYYLPLTITWYIATDGQTFTNQVTLPTNTSKQISQNITYTTDGKKTIAINISSGSIIDRYNETLELKSIGIYDYDVYNLNESKRLMTFTARNYWPQSQSINWNVSDPSVTSNVAANLSENEPLIVFIENNYTTQGRKTPKINAYNNSFLDSYIGSFMVKMVEITGNLVLFENQTSTVQVITAVNNIGQRLISWLFKTDTQSISSNQDVSLNTSEQIFIVIESNYSAGGMYPTNITINSTSFNDTSSGFAIT